jgi:hypothetical protein
MLAGQLPGEAAETKAEPSQAKSAWMLAVVAEEDKGRQEARVRTRGDDKVSDDAIDNNDAPPPAKADWLTTPSPSPGVAQNNVSMHL